MDEALHMKPSLTSRYSTSNLASPLLKCCIISQPLIVILSCIDQSAHSREAWYGVYQVRHTISIERRTISTVFRMHVFASDADTHMLRVFKAPHRILVSDFCVLHDGLPGPVRRHAEAAAHAGACAQGQRNEGVCCWSSWCCRGRYIGV